MRILVMSGIAVSGVAALGAVGFFILGCSLYRPAPQTTSHSVTSAPTAAATSAPSAESRAQAADPSPAVVRVGGDMETMTKIAKSGFRSGVCRITTPLPAGYPMPTPPGAIEIKRYPVVRRAEIGGKISPDWGMNFAFFPLFNHIKRQEIAMTSPVEMNYENLEQNGAQKPGSWTMSFVYRTTDLGPTGVDPMDDRILIEDIPAMTVVAVGMQGSYKLRRVKEGLATLRAWLSQHPEWEEFGDPRSLYYNGPEMGDQDKWSEVQILVRKRSSEAAATYLDN